MSEKTRNSSQKISVFNTPFINLDNDCLFSALQEKIIDDLIEDTLLLKPFMEKAIKTFKFIPC